MSKFQVMPDLTNEEYQQLKDSIREKGMQVPIIMDKTETHIIDGHNRYNIAMELRAEGFDIQTPIHLSDLDPTDEKGMRLLAYELNLHRRHLSSKDRKKYAEKMLVEFPEISNRQAAKLANIGEATVRRMRKEMEDDGKIEEVKVTTGLDGRTIKKSSASMTQSEDGNYIKVGIVQGNTIQTTKILKGFKARLKKVCPVEMIDTIVNAVNNAKLPPNEEGWNMVKKIVEERSQAAKEIKRVGVPMTPPEDTEVVETLSITPGVGELETQEEKNTKPLTKTQKLLHEFRELEEKKTKAVNDIINQTVEDLAGAIGTPVFSEFLNKAVKKKLKEIHPDVSKDMSDEAQQFVNAWNVIKKYLHRGGSK